MLIAAIAGGFGAVFGVPLAGCVFALEVQAVGRIRYDALVAALTASIAGDLAVRGIDIHHAPVPHFADVTLTPAPFAKVVVASLAFGLVAIVVSELTHRLKRVFGATVRWAPARPLIGGLVIVGLASLVGNNDYLGLSIPLISKSLAGGAGVVLFTWVTLGSGFQGGEVTPLFVIGATLGATLGHLLGAPVPLMAAIGFVAVFAGATNTPLACTVMAVELFGSGPIVLFAVACVIAYVTSSHRGIYHSQRIDTPKGALDHGDGHTLDAVAGRRRHWLPPIATTTSALGDAEEVG